jgi:hypothetical protein
MKVSDLVWGIVMVNNITKKSRLPILTALLILLCLSFYGCENTAADSVTASSSSSRTVSLSSSSQVSSSQAVSAESPAVNSAVQSSSQTSGAARNTVSKAAATSSAQFSKFVTLTIDATKGNDGVVLNGKKVGITAGETVYSLLKRYCMQNKILIAETKTGNGIYVSAIDGIAQFDCGSQSGWIYSVGGIFPQKDCNSYKLNGGEAVKWIYTIDLGKSEENR